MLVMYMDNIIVVVQERKFNTECETWRDEENSAGGVRRRGWNRNTAQMDCWIGGVPINHQQNPKLPVLHCFTPTVV